MLKKKKLQFIKYIIYLIIKVFIFNNKFKYFKVNAIIKKSINNLKIIINFWKNEK